MTTAPHDRSEVPATVPTVALADARAELSKIVTLAEHTGRITAITRYGKPVAAVVPAALLHLLSGAHIGPRPMAATDIERIAARARSADTQPSSDDIRTVMDDVKADSPDPHAVAAPADLREERVRAIAEALSEWIDTPLSAVIGVHRPRAEPPVDSEPGAADSEPTIGDVLEALAIRISREAAE
ncbi:type II toxin-antitoxin system Phd/YefM family antitoxin [Kitasatospora sp. NPDC059722]|uniref:type II toxin-antitoxin system Phd/YefM family antitoxin n=1 Tax=Kitasatospora sp. NPDC059722 TaxID=3346925 RepID=UPI0036895AEC